MAIELHHLNTHRMMEQAGNVLDGVVRLKQRIAELEEERRWRKFIEEKPNEKQWILVYYPYHSNYTTGVEVRCWDEGCKYDVEMQEIYEKWMPLPKEPEVPQ